MIQATNDPFPATPGEPAPRGRGCFFWGCMTLGVVGLLIGGCTAYAAYVLYESVKTYTATTPLPVPVQEVKPGEQEAVQRRVDAYEKAPAGQAATLELSAADLNTLLVKGEPRLAGKAFVRIEDNKLFLDVSLPLKDIPFLSVFPGLNDRFFNGKLALRPAIAGGRLDLKIDQATVGDKELPRQFIDEFAASMVKDFAEDVESGAQGRLLEGAESLEVRDGKVILKR